MIRLDENLSLNLEDLEREIDGLVGDLRCTTHALTAVADCDHQEYVHSTIHAIQGHTLDIQALLASLVLLRKQQDTLLQIGKINEQRKHGG